MSYKLPPNHYLQFYPPPPHPPPSHTTSQRKLRFRDFHSAHFIQNKNFFRQALNPTTPWWLWRTEGSEETVGGESYQQNYQQGYQQQPPEGGYTSYEYREEHYKEEDPKLEFVL